jgi:hypothetical protein
VNEYVLSAIIRLDEAKTLGRVKPLYGTSSHNDAFLSQRVYFPRNRAGVVVFERKVVFSA